MSIAEDARPSSGRNLVPPALRHRQYLIFWLSSITALGAQQIAFIGMGWLIYELTESAYYIGLAGLAIAVPGITLSLFGGVMADRLELRRLLAQTQYLMTALTVILAVLAMTGIVQPWHILVLAFLTGCSQAFNNPARQAIYPQLVPREDLTSAVALNSMLWQGVRIIAPAAGGIMIAVAGIAATFFACAVGYALFAIVVGVLRVSRPARRDTPIMAAIIEGPKFVLSSSLFTALIGLTFFNSFFGIALLQLFPLFVRETLDVGPTGLGFMYSAIGVGSIGGLALASALTSYPDKGKMILGGGFVYGLVILLFAFATWYPIALLVLFFMGFFSQIYMVSVQTALQMEVPDQLRGRVMGIYTMTYNMGPLGATQGGAIAGLVSPAASILVAGAAISLLAGSLALTNREVRELSSARSGRRQS